MTGPEIGLWVLRAVGALYLAGGLIGMRQAIFAIRAEPMMDSMLDVLDRMRSAQEGRPAPAQRVTDTGRNWWLLAGAALLTLAAAAMIAGHVSALWLLVALVLQQMLYFVRQQRRALSAANDEHAREIRPQRATVNGFYGSLGATVLAAWLYGAGALWA